MRILWEMHLWTRKKLLNFESPLLLDPDPGIFFKDSSALRDRVFFHDSARVAGKTYQIIFSEIFLCNKSSLKFWNHPDLVSGFSILTVFTMAVACTLQVLLFEFAPDSFRIFLFHACLFITGYRTSDCGATVLNRPAWLQLVLILRKKFHFVAGCRQHWCYRPINPLVTTEPPLCVLAVPCLL